MANIVVTIDGNNIKDYGLKLISHHNLNNMPSRVGKVFYEWGDEIQPLVGENEIAWGAHKISLDCLFDSRFNNLNLSKTLSTLQNMKNVLLVITEDGVTVYNKFVNLLSVKDTDVRVPLINTSEKEIANLTVIFEDRTIEFEEFSTTQKTGELNIDGYDFFKSFGIITEDVRYLYDIPEHETSGTTVYKTPKRRTDTRKWGKVRIDCVATDFDKLEQFKSLLASPELKNLSYKIGSYKCFSSRGFTVKKKRGLGYFNLELNIGEKQAALGVYGFLDGQLSNPEVEIKNYDVSPQESDGTHYGEVNWIGFSKTHYFRIRNNSAEAITGISVELDPDGDPQFSIEQIPSSSLNPTYQTSFQIRFDPDNLQEPKLYSTKVYVKNVTDNPNSPFVFAIAGDTFDNISIGNMQVRGEDNSVISDGSTTISEALGTDFGEVIENNVGSSVFKVYNTGNRPIEITGVSTVNSDFSVTGNIPSTVNAGDFFLLPISYKPSSISTDNGTIEINWKDGLNDIIRQYDFAVRGVGIVQPVLTYVEVYFIPTDMRVPNGAAADTLYGTQWNERNIGSPLSRAFRLVNTGSEPIISAEITGSPDFAWYADPDGGLDPNGTSYVWVVFSPTTEGIHDAEISIKTATTECTFNLQGEGLPEPDIKMVRLEGKGVEISLEGNYPRESDGSFLGTMFSNGGGLSSTFTLRNIGNVPIVLDRQLENTNSDFDVTIISNTTLQTGDEISFSVSINPQGLEREHASNVRLYDSELTRLFSLNVSAEEIDI